MKSTKFYRSLLIGLTLSPTVCFATNPPHDMYNGIPCSTRFETAAQPNGNLLYCHLAWDMPLWTVPSNGASGQITCKANSYTHFNGNNQVDYCVQKDGTVFNRMPAKATPKPVNLAPKGTPGNPIKLK